MHIVRKLLSEDEQTVCASRDAQLVTLYSRERLERGACGAAAVRAMAIQRI